MAAQDQFQKALEAGDVDQMLGIWRATHPHLPLPANRQQAEVAMHMARTVAESLTLKARAYSHAWLVERNWPSQLPDRLKKPAERLYPRKVSAVGISFLREKTSPLGAVLGAAREAMQDAVLEADADGLLLDTAHVSRRMAEAKALTYKRLLG